jgi:hypothetical protein
MKDGGKVERGNNRERRMKIRESRKRNGRNRESELRRN